MGNISREENYLLRLLTSILDYDKLQSYLNHLKTCIVRKPAHGFSTGYNCWYCAKGESLIKQLKIDAQRQIDISFPGYKNYDNSVNLRSNIVDDLI